MSFHSDRDAHKRNVDQLTHELQDTRDKCEEMRGAKQDAVREVLTLQEQQRAELRLINNALHDEQHTRESLERRLGDLRTELERLQAENAAEWGKRERLESEKLALERDNKKMRCELREQQSSVRAAERRGGGGGINSPASVGGGSAAASSTAGSVAADPMAVRGLQQSLVERNKELSEARMAHVKLKKLLAETNTELGHAGRRAEQYEAEVKRLRGRVEELKMELAGAEDELDATCNHVRRLQRQNEELLTHMDMVPPAMASGGASGNRYVMGDSSMEGYLTRGSICFWDDTLPALFEKHFRFPYDLSFEEVTPHASYASE